MGGGEGVARGGRGEGGMEGGKKIICLSLHCHHHNDSCIKVVEVGEEGDYIPVATLSPPE